MNTDTATGHIIPYAVIAAAIEGDPQAIQSIVRHYRGYIIALATYVFYDK